MRCCLCLLCVLVCVWNYKLLIPWLLCSYWLLQPQLWSESIQMREKSTLMWALYEHNVIKYEHNMIRKKREKDKHDRATAAGNMWFQIINERYKWRCRRKYYFVFFSFFFFSSALTECPLSLLVSCKFTHLCGFFVSGCSPVRACVRACVHLLSTDYCHSTQLNACSSVLA